MKKHILIFKIAIILLISILFQNVVFAQNNTIETNIENTQNEAKKISITQNEIKVNNQNISNDNSSDLYLANEENGLKIINITNPGKYEFSGKAENLQIAINIEELEKIEIILNNLQITNQNSPAIIIYNGFEFFLENDAGVVLNLLEGTENKLVGADIENYEGVISSNVSAMINGGGKLSINAKKEGIETKKNLLINNGNIEIQSKGNAIDACLENESIIRINKTNLIANVDKTSKEGSAIYSASKIIINDGKIYAYSSLGFDGINAKNILEINGGTIISTGNMMKNYDKNISKQLGIFIGFKQNQISGRLITLTKIDKTPIFAYVADREISGISYSSENLKEDTYKVFIDGTIIGDLKNNLYTNITTYSAGEEQKYVQNLSDENTADIVEFNFSRQADTISNLEKVVVQTNIVEEVAVGDYSEFICLGIALIILFAVIGMSKKDNKIEK